MPLSHKPADVDLDEFSSGGAPDGQVPLADGSGNVAWGAAEASAASVRGAGRWEVVISGTAPPVATTNEAADDWVYGWISG